MNENFTINFAEASHLLIASSSENELSAIIQFIAQSLKNGRSLIVSTYDDLESLCHEMEQRLKSRKRCGEPIVAVIENYADQVRRNPEIQDVIARLGQKGRAVEIYMVLPMLNPSKQELTGMLKAAFPSRIAFHLPSKEMSIRVLDVAGAEKLNDGEMLFSDGLSLAKIQFRNLHNEKKK